jgi:hypothetical protein
MTMTSSDNRSAKRITVQIPTASGDMIEARVYLPEGSGPHPAVVMAHGIGGIKAGGLARSPSASARRASPPSLSTIATSAVPGAAARSALRPAPARGLQHRHRLGR